MARIDIFSTDDDGAENGTWVELRPGTGMRFRIRSIHSKAYRKADTLFTRRHRLEFTKNLGVLDVEDQDAQDIELGARLLTGWEGVDDAAGNPISFSRDAAVKLLTMYPQLRREIFLYARSDETFKPASVLQAELDAMAKNSERPSSTPIA